MNDMEHKMPLKTGIVLTAVLSATLLAFSIVLESIGLTQGWMGFLFFWFWSSVRGFKIDRNFRNDIINSIVGIILSGLLYYLRQKYGADGFKLAITVVLIVVLSLLVTKAVPYIVGDATFLFFTVLTGHEFIMKSNYLELICSYTFGVLFFSLVLGIAFKLMNFKNTGETAVKGHQTP